MYARSRHGRTLFLYYVMTTWVAVLAAAPLMHATARVARVPFVAQETQFPIFEQVDKNRDGFIDKGEAAAVPGLLAVFDQADTNQDQKLDKVEFAKALSLLELPTDTGGK